MRGRGSKPGLASPSRHAGRRPPCGGVDRNSGCARRRALVRRHVAPRAGAWIETRRAAACIASAGRPPRGGVDRNEWAVDRPGGWRSPPARGRGSKRPEVAEHGGVAPRAGAWIEPAQAAWAGSGRPPRGGVDRNRSWTPAAWSRSRRPPRGGVDRNKRQMRQGYGERPSPPARGRGSKPTNRLSGNIPAGSPPARGRGSKQVQGIRQLGERTVAPRAGAWIETRPAVGTSRGCVAPRAGAWIETSAWRRDPSEGGRPPRGGVDRNYLDAPPRAGGACRPPRGGVDRNCIQRATAPADGRRPPRGGVDRNTAALTARVKLGVAPRAGAWIETGSTIRTSRSARSPPARGRGSKHEVVGSFAGRSRVAPRAGAWIETRRLSTGHDLGQTSPPARGRGSKHLGDEVGRDAGESPPARGRGSKLARGQPPKSQVASPPARGRGSKL